jgi:hypothetical protein
MNIFKRKKPFKIKLNEIPRYRELYKLYKGLRKKQIAKVIETNITYERNLDYEIYISPISGIRTITLPHVEFGIKNISIINKSIEPLIIET